MPTITQVEKAAAAAIMPAFALRKTMAPTANGVKAPMRKTTEAAAANGLQATEAPVKKTTVGVEAAAANGLMAAEAPVKTVKRLSAPEKAIMHPLEHRWTFWWFKNDRSKTWEENQKQVATVGYIEEFWALVHHIQDPSTLESGHDYR